MLFLAAVTAILVIPGGRYAELAMDLDCSEPCSWITSRAPITQWPRLAERWLKSVGILW